MKLTHAAPFVARAALASACVLLAAGCAAHSMQARRAPGACSARALDLIESERVAKQHVVLVRSDIGMGTGFVLADPDPSSITIVTNYHVIASGRHFEIDLPAAGGEPIAIASVKVVKVDPIADLAILRVPRVERGSRGLELSKEGARLGQPIAAFGFPFVAGSKPTLTVERGDVTAAERVIGTDSFVQTNANINPGNSGGPVLDACGEVVGVVVARVTSTDRVALIIPVQKVRAVLAAAAAPAKDPQVAARARLDAFLGALDGQDFVMVSELTSRELIDVAMKDALRKSVEDIYAKLDDLQASLARKGISVEKLSDEQWTRVTSVVLDPSEQAVWRIADAMREKRVDERTGVRLYYAMVTAEIFGKVAGYEVERMSLERNHARATVSIQSDRGRERYIMVLVEEWGDWQVAGFKKA